MGLPFINKLAAYAPIILGIIFFLCSSSEKFYQSLVENFGEKSASKQIKLFKFGGPILVLVGIIQYFLL